MTTAQAIDYVNANLAAIGNAARLNNEAARDVIGAYAQMCQYRHEVTEELLVCAVEGWQDYCAENPQAEL